MTEWKNEGWGVYIVYTQMKLTNNQGTFVENGLQRAIYDDVK